jgi:hypothetical protein
MPLLGRDKHTCQGPSFTWLWPPGDLGFVERALAGPDLGLRRAAMRAVRLRTGWISEWTGLLLKLRVSPHLEVRQEAWETVTPEAVPPYGWAGRCFMWSDVPFSCSDSGCMWLNMALCLRSLAPSLAPRDR